MITTYFFDIDGTLLDSAPDICGAVCEVCPEIPEAVVRRYIGRSLAEMFADFYPGIPQERIDELSRVYTERYRARAHRNTRVFPGVAEMVATLPGRKSTATTKRTATAGLVLEQFGLRQHFNHIQGSDNGRYKPDPSILFEAMQALDARPEECMIVGDTAADIEAGKRANIRTCAVAWGYGDPAELRSLQLDFWIDRPEDLLLAFQPTPKG